MFPFEDMNEVTGEKPYQCKEFGNIFTPISGLNEHVRIHREESMLVVNVKNILVIPKQKIYLTREKFHWRKTL
jgi:hypothetical protein